MNTSAYQDQQVKPAVTSADVLAFLVAKRVELRDPGATFHAYVSPGTPQGLFLVSSIGHNGASGKSADEVVHEFNRLIKTPEERAADLRAKAQKFIDEANALTAQPPTGQAA